LTLFFKKDESFLQIIEFQYQKNSAGIKLTETNKDMFHFFFILLVSNSFTKRKIPALIKSRQEYIIVKR